MKKLFLGVLMTLTLFVLSACSRSYTVTFIDFDFRVIETIEVKRGESVEPPENPERFGYYFDRWDQSLDNIREDMTIKALYIQNEELKAFNDLIFSIIHSNQLTAITTVTINGEVSNNYEYLREDDTISSRFFNETETKDLFLTLEGTQRYGYEYFIVDGCWAYVPITDTHFNIIRFEHSRINMLPSSVELHWFNYEEGTYVLKTEYHSNLAQRTAMDGAFRLYEFTITEDGLTIYIEVQQGFSRLGYLIEFTGIDNTTVEVPEFDVCVVD